MPHLKYCSSRLHGRERGDTEMDPSGFVVLFVKCNVFVAMYPRTTFYGFGSTTATCSPSPGRRRLPWPRPSRGSWCRSPTTSFSSGGDLSSPPSTRLLTGSFDQQRATVSRRRRWWHCLDSIYCLSGCRGRSTLAWSGSILTSRGGGGLFQHLLLWHI